MENTENGQAQAALYKRGASCAKIKKIASLKSELLGTKDGEGSQLYVKLAQTMSLVIRYLIFP